MTALAVRLSAESPFWDFVFVAGIAAMIASTAHGAAERITGQKKMDPLLALAGIAVVIAAVALGLYILRGPHKAISAAPGPDAVSQPELSLLLPKDRYIFKWDPTVGMYFDIQREGLPLPAGQTANPGFVLHNASKTAAADVAITWHAEISGFKELAKVGHAAKYEIKFLDDYTMDLISGTAHPVPNF